MIRTDASVGEALAEGSILLVDDDLVAIRVMRRILLGVGRLRFATGAEDALRLARESVPDLILLDAEMPGLNGFQLCRILKADPVLGDVPVIFVTSHGDAVSEVAGFDLGAADFITKPVNAALVQARVKAQLRHKRNADELRRISTIDALTGVANRRSFNQLLQREWRRVRRAGESLAVLMLDVDHFKQFNDRYGHPAGDACLHAVAQCLLATSQRSADLVARYGGEEFVLLLPYTARDGARQLAQRMLDAVAELAIEHRDSPTAPHVTLSGGLACYDELSPCWMEPTADSRLQDGTGRRCSPGDMVLAADRALYAAKQGGRAQVRTLDVAEAAVLHRG